MGWQGELQHGLLLRPAGRRLRRAAAYDGEELGALQLWGVALAASLRSARSVPASGQTAFGLACGVQLQVMSVMVQRRFCVRVASRVS